MTICPSHPKTPTHGMPVMHGEWYCVTCLIPEGIAARFDTPLERRLIRLIAEYARIPAPWVLATSRVQRIQTARFLLCYTMNHYMHVPQRVIGEKMGRSTNSVCDTVAFASRDGLEPVADRIWARCYAHLGGSICFDGLPGQLAMLAQGERDAVLTYVLHTVKGTPQPPTTVYWGLAALAREPEAREVVVAWLPRCTDLPKHEGILCTPERLAWQMHHHAVQASLPWRDVS